MLIRSTHNGAATSRLARNSRKPMTIAINVRCVRLCSRGAYTWLEPDDGKLSSPVLRGGGGSDAASLPDEKPKGCLPARFRGLSRHKVAPDESGARVDGV